MNLYTHYFKNSKFTNFGDELVIPILEFLNPGAEVEHVDRNHEGKILCIGSGRDTREPVKLAFTHSSNIAKATREQFWLPAPVHDREGLLFAWRNQ